MYIRVVALPEAMEFRRRLCEAYSDAVLEKGFYPLLVAEAGQKKTAYGIALMFSMKAHEFVQQANPKTEDFDPQNICPRLIAALISDTELAQEAVAIYKESLNFGKWRR
jgi:hypothetical protein